MEDLMDLTDREKQLMLERDQLAAEKQKIFEERLKAEDEFGKIRAKFKDLYLQREAEIIRITEEKKQVEAEMSDVRAVAVLSQTTAQEEMDALLRRYNEEIRSLKIQLQESQSAVQNFNDTTRNDNDELNPENLEDSMLKAQKDTEMLKEIIVPLETELREVKLQCQQLMSENMRLRDAQAKDDRPQPTVDMLLNLEEEEEEEDGGAVVAVEDNEVSKQMLEDSEREVAALKEERAALITEKEELSKKNIEVTESYNLLREEATSKATELEELKRSVQTTETKWSDMTTRFTEKVEFVTGSFQALRESHDSLLNDYQDSKKKSAADLNDLHEYRAKLEEDLGKLKMKLSDERSTHENAQALLTDSLESCRQEILRLESVSSELQTSRELNEKLQSDVVKVTDALNETQRKSKDVILGLQKQIISSNSEKEHLEAQIMKLRKELTESLSVRDELAIQSSELQVRLESQKDLLKSIKWEHEDDVTNCRGCDVAFSMTKRKSHCRKCGRIFCNDCCSHLIEFGENRRQYKACAECHTRHKAEQPAEYHTVTVPRT